MFGVNWQTSKRQYGIVEERGVRLWDQTPKTIMVYHDADHPSHLLLPITRGNVVETFIGAPRAKKV